MLISVSSDQFAASETLTGVFGKVIVSDQASAAGAASVPSPVGNADAPWFVYEPFVHVLAFSSAIGFEEGSGATSNFTIDSKAMHKVSLSYPQRK
jgi:hypothetical protein